jgi:hypothetical protein
VEIRGTNRLNCFGFSIPLKIEDAKDSYGDWTSRDRPVKHRAQGAAFGAKRDPFPPAFMCSLATIIFSSTGLFQNRYNDRYCVERDIIRFPLSPAFG